MSVQSTVDSRNIRVLPLVRFMIPGHDVGFHYGGRKTVHNGFTYQPNKFLQSTGLDQKLGTQKQSRTLVFSNVPDDGDTILPIIKTLPWKNATVILSWLVGEMGADSAAMGPFDSQFFEIHDIPMEWSERKPDGSRTATIQVLIGPVGARVSNQGSAKSAAADHHYDNDPDDTFFEYTSTVGNWTVEWGQR